MFRRDKPVFPMHKVTDVEIAQWISGITDCSNILIFSICFTTEILHCGMGCSITSLTLGVLRSMPESTWGTINSILVVQWER